MIATRKGLARLIDWQAIVETLVFKQYRAILPMPGWVTLDIGAGIGDYALWAVRRGAQCIAYECDRFCLPALNCNAIRFGFTAVEMRVQDLRLLPDADLIKVDIEGGEYAVTGWERYPRIILEYHEPYGASSELESRLGAEGYQTMRYPNRHRADIGILAACRPNLGLHLTPGQATKKARGMAGAGETRGVGQ